MKSPTRFSSFAVLLLATFSAYSLAYGLQVVDGVFKNDHFRHFRYIVIPLLTQSFDSSLLFINHHASPLLHFHEILSIRLYDGLLYYDLIVTGCLLFILAVVLTLSARRYFAARDYPPLIQLLCSLPVGIIIVSLTSQLPYSWPLVSLSSYHFLLGTSAAIVACSVFDNQRDSGPWLHLLMVALVFFAVVMHSSFGSLFAAAIAVYSLYNGFAQKRPVLVVEAFLILFFLYLWNAVFLPTVRAVNYGQDIDVVYWLSEMKNLHWYVTAFGKGLFDALHGFAFRGSLGLSREAEKLIFLVYGTIFLLLMIRAAMKKHGPRLAGLLMLTVFLGAIAAALTRSEESSSYWAIAAPRYVLFYRLGCGALVWILFDLLGDLCRLCGRWRFRLMLLPVVVVIGGIGYSHYVSGRSLWGSAAYFRSIHANHELAVYMTGVDADNTFSLAGFVSGRNGPKVYMPVIEWLADEQLNVFHPTYRAYSQLRGYKQAAEIEGSAIREGARSTPQLENNCFTVAHADSIRAWTLSFYSEEKGTLQVKRLAGDAGHVSYFVLPGSLNHKGILEPGSQYGFCFSPNVTVSSLALTLHEQ